MDREEVVPFIKTVLNTDKLQKSIIDRVLTDPKSGDPQEEFKKYGMLDIICSY